MLADVTTRDVVGIVVRLTYLNASQELSRAIAKNAGLGETLRHPHVLQHTDCDAAGSAGSQRLPHRQALGHKSFDSTLAYVNLSDADTSAALAKAFYQAV